MTITLTALQKQRRDTAANWTANNPTLLAGELGLESDTGYWKVGDGSTAWTSLAYISGLGGEIAVSRLADGSAGQIIQTDSAGTGVEWSSTANLPLGSASAPAYRFQGDANTGIYSPGADQVAISTNGTQRLLIEADGDINIDSGGVFYDATNNRLAIGTTSPAGRLDVRGGTIEFDPGAGEDSTRAFNFNIGNANFAKLLVPQGSGGALAIHTGVVGAVSERLRIDISGRLLVGTPFQSGGSLLQVNDNRIRIATAKTPASATDTGVAGEICWDANYVYVCTATNTWKRTAISTW